MRVIEVGFSVEPVYKLRPKCQGLAVRKSDRKTSSVKDGRNTKALKGEGNSACLSNRRPRLDLGGLRRLGYGV